VDRKPSASGRDALAVLFALVLPSIVTWLYFFQAAEAKSSIQLAVFGLMKVVQFAFPILWVWFAHRGELTGRFPSRKGIAEGLLFGAVIAAAMFVLYFGFLKGSPALASAIAPIQKKVAGFGVDSVAKYAALGLFYSLCHSLLEEYYWRWFVFGRLQKLTSLPAAIVISSVGFMAHHVLVLGLYFGFFSWQTAFFSSSVAVGGVVWAWLYHRHQSLLGPWLSHLLVDAAIFAIGYDIVRDML
jgi:membrane protease YdiL (CAAX protease family)